MESRLHLALKKAVETHLAGGNHCWYESHMGPWGGSGSLRVDVHYNRNKRSIYVECETRPSISRLIEKGKRRVKVPYRNVYILVVPDEYYGRLEWQRLRGYFDLVLGYDVEDGVFTGKRDLRFMGPLRDAALDFLIPIYKSERVQGTLNRVTRRKNILKMRLRGRLQCLLCRLDLPSPWIFCPGDGCSDSVPYLERASSN
jgi:hypothetical protein